MVTVIWCMARLCFFCLHIGLATRIWERMYYRDIWHYVHWDLWSNMKCCIEGCLLRHSPEVYWWCLRWNFWIDKSSEMIWTISTMTVCQHPMLISWCGNPRTNNKLNSEAGVVNGQGLNHIITQGASSFFFFFFFLHGSGFIATCKRGTERIDDRWPPSQ